MIVSVRHDQREKPNNLKLIQQTKVLILNRLADEAKARLPTFLHNLHLNIHSISLTFRDIHQKPTCRLFDSIQFCVASVLVIHRIFFVSTSDIPDNRCLTECDFIRENPPSSGQVVFSSNLSVKPHLFTDKLSILSQLFTVIGSWWRAGQPRTAKS